jgi:hypothetical protein
MSHINEFYAHYESMGLIATALHEPDTRGTSPAMTSCVIERPFLYASINVTASGMRAREVR